MIMKENQCLTSDRGATIRVDAFIGRGGQGEVYRATKAYGENGVVKVLSDAARRRADRTRIRFLRDQNLSDSCGTLLGPTDLVEVGHRVGHFAPLAGGEALDDVLAKPTQYTFHDQLTMATALAHSVSVLEERNIAHGDLHAGNVFVDTSQNPPALQLIDFDNFATPNQPPPVCIGQVLYMAPELRKALENGEAAVLSVESDRFALGVCLHEIILLRHPADGSDATPEAFHEAMTQGWVQDPMRNTPSTSAAGYPTDTLNAALMRLFRAALSTEAEDRPSARQWTQTLAKALKEVIQCPHCGGPSLTDTARKICPHCNNQFPSLQLVLEQSGKVIPLDRGAIPLGRDELGGSTKVSAQHCVFRRIGPETHLESFGRNGTYRQVPSSVTWVRLPDRTPVLVREGDRLLFADQRGRLQRM